MKGLNAYKPDQLFTDGVLGQYSLGTFTGLLAAGTNGEIFQFRWPDELRLAAIRRIMLSAVASTPFGATPATAPIFLVQKATAWTVQGSGGFGIGGLAGYSRRSQMPTTLATANDIRIANTANLGAGTKALTSGAPFQVVGCPVSAATGPVLPPTDMLNLESSERDYPLTLAPFEGFVVSVSNNPGTGTMVVSVQVDWIEAHAS